MARYVIVSSANSLILLWIDWAYRSYTLRTDRGPIPSPKGLQSEQDKSQTVAILNHSLGSRGKKRAYPGNGLLVYAQSMELEEKPLMVT